MSPATPLQHSVQARLVAYARQIGVDPNLILARYANERLLHRISSSRYAERFVLKGAMLLVAWLGEMIRPTRDVDPLGFGDLSDAAIATMFAEVVIVDVEPDGVTFDPSSIDVAPIRAEDAYGGKRVTIAGHLGPARLRVQIDIGIGDAVFPDPQWIDYPSLLDLPRPRLRAYRPETSIAEKLHAMVTLGSKNSRMRDFFDVGALATREDFDGRSISRAIQTTFHKRGVEIPRVPLALTPAFANVAGKRDQWSGFLRKNRLPSIPFDEVIQNVAEFLTPVIASLVAGHDFDKSWPPGGPWA
jgi:predicted nucleotidyltransferase component of viral defense system